MKTYLMKSYVFLINSFRLNMMLWIALLGMGSAAGYGQTPLKPNPKAEAWVEKQISRGEKADLYDQFPEGECVIRAASLGKLFNSLSSDDSSASKIVEIRHAIVTGVLDLRQSDFTRGISMTDCQFEGPVFLSHCYFPHVLNLEDSIFREIVDLREIRADDLVSFHQTVFEGSVDMTGAFLQGDWAASQARFLNQAQGVILSGLEVAQNVYWKESIFDGPVRGADAAVGGRLIADDARFLDKEVGVNFVRLFAGGLASFNQAVFEGPVDFSNADVQEGFQAFDAQFNHPAQPVLFVNFKTKGRLDFSKSSFLGSVQCTGMELGGSLNVSDASFKNPNCRVDFSETITGDAFFENCHFDGLLLLNHFIYRNLYAGDREGVFDNALALVETAKFNPDSYRRLERSIHEQGFSQAADAIFIAQKERERRERLAPYSMDWFINGFLGWAAGHGRHPERVLLISFLIVMFGVVFVFRASRMTPVDSSGEALRHRFWYSLDLFLPLVDLQMARQWTPRSNWARHYQRIHTLSGWIFVPLFWASLFGWLK
ncbi:MAG: hypothetical protein JXR73_17525 [Candidatus Omnitrophica bacterium]|nr:hypothetical protein [Candidatus Omnitrophota bacterium]